MTAATRARMIAFYLPQFHPIAENDEWWGKGFTEWTNVARARPLFAGHHQPHVPAELGYYDLRVGESRAAQAQLAGDHGIEAFCYWHYWFRGKRLLHRPFDEVLRSGRPELPFCLAWANHAWTRGWLDDGDGETLQSQDHAPEDDLRHVRWLCEAFADSRYLTVDGRPVFAVYRPLDLPAPERTAEVFRAESTRLGLPEPFLLGINAYHDIDYREVGFDGTISFEPRLGVLRDLRPVMTDPTRAQLGVYDYREARARMLATRRAWPTYPSIVVDWDNTPRRGDRGTVLVNGGPAPFRAGLQQLVDGVQERDPQHRLVFVNAWNEWAEGNHLEPDRRHGVAFLDAVRSVVTSAPIVASRHGHAPSMSATS